MKAKLLSLVPLGIALTVAGFSRDASADAGPHFNTGVFFPVGLNVGYSVNPDKVPNGFVFGGEASVVYFNKNLFWVGAYGDALRDFGKDETRFSFGPEIGLGPLGLDGGYLIAVKDGGHGGFVGRFMITFSLAAIYGRVGHIGDGDQTFGEMGLLFKIPIPLWSEPNERWGPNRTQPETAPIVNDPKPTEPPTPSGPIAPDEPQGPFAPPPPDVPPPPPTSP